MTDLAPASPASPGGAGANHIRPRRGRLSLLSRRDKVVLGLMIGVPTFLDLVFIWLPTLASIGLSLTNWNGATALTAKNFVGLKNYQFLFTSYIPFWPAVAHNLIWLLFFVCVATPLGIFFAVLLDRELRGSVIYQNVFYLPVVLSLVIVGFIWELQYAPTDGFINGVLGRTGQDNLIDWLGNPAINIWAVVVAASWRHVGYIMVLYLAGLKSVDPGLREAAAIDGAGERQIFFRVVFPVMAPINVIIVVVTVIESLRAFDLAFIINQGTNGLELLSTLITNNSLSEASLIGFGSAIAVVLLTISLVPIVIFLTRVMRDQTA
ncbi:MAG TPA: sugar ABC transporter permease [Candidatus Sulfotelmatobacter sp.]|nr:sugar ABC transporter permease [Candidatus Sulfotelmatobacter sp.]